MNIFQELRQRRVPQIVSGYVVGSWGLIQFLDFLESRMTVSPNLINLVGIGLLLLLPSIVLLAWVHGRPGRDTWGRIPKVLVPANILAIVLLLFFLFRGQELGAIIKIIEVQDENGAISERVVPKGKFRRRIILFYPENIGNEEDDWARETINTLLAIDLDQDVFVDPARPMSIVGAMKDVGSDDGHGLTRPLQRKLAHDFYLPFFLTSTISRESDNWIFTSELHESESGRVLAKRTTEAADLFILADLASRQLREDLEIPSSHLESSPDLPIAELTSSNFEAVKSFVKGLIAITHENDWAQGGIHFDDAVERDPGYAMAHFMRFVVFQTLAQPEKSTEAIVLAMDNLFRIPERSSFMIKAQYYYNVKKDVDKSMAVLEMWSQIYPNDIEVYSLQANNYFIMQDLPRTIAAYENILALDPSRVAVIRKIADLHRQLENLDKAEEFYLRFVERFPTDTTGFRDLADFYSGTGQLDLARKTLDKAQLIEPNDLDLILGLVNLDIKEGNFDQSLFTLDAEMDRAKTSNDRSKILLRRISLAGLLGRADQLILDLESYYETSLEIQNPMQADIVYSMLLSHICTVGQPELALQQIDSASSRITPPYDKLVGFGRAWALSDLGRTKEAQQTLADAAEVVETFKFEAVRPNLALVGGMIAEKEGDFPTAVSLYRTAMETTLEKALIFKISLAGALRKNGQTDDAKKLLESALKINPSHPELHLEIALVQKDLGKLEQSREHLKMAQDAWGAAHPDFPPALAAKALAAEIN